MTLVIDDEDVVLEINRRAAGLHLSPAEIVKDALIGSVKNPEQSMNEAEVERRLNAIRRAQQWFAEHLDPNHQRSADEIIGYNKHGHFD